MVQEVGGEVGGEVGEGTPVLMVLVGWGGSEVVAAGG